MFEITNSDGHQVSFNPKGLVEIIYIDRQTSKSGSQLICRQFSDKTAEAAEVLVARTQDQVGYVNFHIPDTGKKTIPVWFNAARIVAVRDVTNGRSVVITELGSATVVVEGYQSVLAAIAGANPMKVGR